MKTLEQIQDERDAPKPQIKPMEEWDQTELRRAMLADAKQIKYSPRLRFDNMSNHDRTDEWKLEATLAAMREIGMPCGQRELAALMEVTTDTVRSYVKLAILADCVVVEKYPGHNDKYYVLTEGYDGDDLLDI